MDPNLPAGFLLKTHPVLVRGGRFWALRGATASLGPGTEIRSPKSCDAAEWLAVQNNFAVQKPLLSSSFYPCTILSRVLPAGLARMEIVIFMTVRFENHAISVLNCNTSTQVASTGNLPPSFLTLAYNPYRLPEMDLAFRFEN
jgi:hypothetical protein